MASEKYNIVIEGFWNIGKTTFLEHLGNLGYTTIAEKNHLREIPLPQDTSRWYIEAHKRNLEAMLGSKEPVAMERSVLSSMAYLYATEKSSSLAESAFQKFKEMCHSRRCLIVFLYGSPVHAAQEIDGIEDPEIRDRYRDPEFIKRYEFFFRNVLPFTYDLVPFCVNVFDEQGQRKGAERIKEAVDAMLAAERIAQANAVLFKNEPSERLFAVLKRNPRKGSFWQTITGGLHPFESLREGVLREISEEVGIHTEADRLIPSNYHFSYIGSEGYEMNEYVFGYRLGPKDEIRTSDEHTDHELLPRDAAIERVKYDGNKRAIEEVSKLD